MEYKITQDQIKRINAFIQDIPHKFAWPIVAVLNEVTPILKEDKLTPKKDAKKK